MECDKKIVLAAANEDGRRLSRHRHVCIALFAAYLSKRTTIGPIPDLAFRADLGQFHQTGFALIDATTQSPDKSGSSANCLIASFASGDLDRLIRSRRSTRLAP